LKFLAVPLVILLLAVTLTLAGAWERFEHMIYDGWFNLRGVQEPSGQVVIVGIDDESIYELGYPIPRDLHAGLLANLGQAAVVSFDFLSDYPTGAEVDAAFGGAIAEHGRVVLVCASLGVRRDEDGEYYQDLRFPIPELIESAAGIGFINMPTDFDNVVRRVLVVNPLGDGMYLPGFHLATLMAARGLNPADVRLDNVNRRVLVGEDIAVPIDRHVNVLTNFWGPGGTFETISYVGVLDGRVPAAFFNGKIVLVGPTTPLAQDIYNTPFTRSNIVQRGALPAPGVELHAGAIETYLTESYFHRAGPAVNLSVLVILGLAVAFTTRRLNAVAGTACLLLLVAGSAAAVYHIWLQAHYWLNLAGPAILMVLMFTGVTTENFLRAELEKRRTRAVFGRYVSPAVMEELLQNQELMGLGGKRRAVSILFSDIRGFTTYSDTHPAEEVVAKLNEYLTRMTAAIFRQGGTLDKYLGDGIMAVFGAPVPCEDHADRAVKVAHEMMEELEKLNAVWEAHGEERFKIGIGISAGEVIVGNVGSPERMDYTVIGGDVNLAARLENMTKEHGTPVIVSVRVYEQLRDEGLRGRFAEIGRVPVRGIAEPVAVYALMKPA
jgi:adenylate cyclase